MPDTPDVLSPAQLAELVAMMAASPLPLDLKEQFADVLDVATQEELARLYVMVKEADVAQDEMLKAGIRASEEMATVQPRINRALRDESDRIVEEYAAVQ